MDEVILENPQAGVGRQKWKKRRERIIPDTFLLL